MLIVVQSIFVVGHHGQVFDPIGALVGIVSVFISCIVLYHGSGYCHRSVAAVLDLRCDLTIMIVVESHAIVNALRAGFILTIINIFFLHLS